MPADLHTHSVCSDGTDTPTQLVQAAAAAGIEVLALTDHDTTAGWEPATDAAIAARLTFIPGEEITCRAGRATVHLLSYLHNPLDPAIRAEAARTRQAREERARHMVSLLGNDVDITWQDVAAQMADDTTIGRPHIADALVAKGLAPDRSAAFDTYLRPGSPYYLPHYAPDAVAMVAAVRRAGGVPVFAHPGARSRGRLVSREVLEAMVEAGLAGLEVFHRDNDPDQREQLLEFARHHDLIVTGSSDYHGSGKPNRLGENHTSAEAVARIIDQGIGTAVVHGEAVHGEVADGG